MNVYVKAIQPQETLCFAAQEFCRYLNRLFPSGQFSPTPPATAPDSIFELSIQSPSDRDAYEIALSSDGGQITGSNPRSVLLGVYKALWLLGCRFLAPGAAHELVPVREETTFPTLRCQEEASLFHRGVCIEGANSAKNVLDFIDWLPKVGYNSFFLQFHLPYTFLRRWYAHELNPLLPPEPFTREDAQRETLRFEQEIHRRGLLLHKVGHGWTGEVLGFSQGDWKAVDSALSPDTLELTAELNGQRGLFHGIPMNTNLCYSNPKVMETFSNRVADYCQKNPNMDYVHVWLADEFNNICECEQCQKTCPSDQYVHILNKIDQKLTAMGLDTKIVFLLYQELLWPPQKERLANPDRFVLMFAPISRTFHASYPLDGMAGQPPEYHRNQVTLPTSLRENLDFLQSWQKVFPGQGFVYDYPMGRAHYGDLGYIHIASIISQDLKKITQMGLDGSISCQELRVNLPNSLPNYVMGRTLFDTSADFSDLVREYFEAAYGPDGPAVQNYLSSLSSLALCDYLNGKGPRVDENTAEKLTCLLDTMEHHFPATDRSALSPVQKSYWSSLDYHREYGQRLARAMLQLALGDSPKARSLWQDFQRFICQHELEYQPDLDVYRISEVTARYTGFSLTSELEKTL